MEAQSQADLATKRDLMELKMRANAVLVDNDKRAIEHMEISFLDVQDRQTFLDRDGFEWRKNAQESDHLASGSTCGAGATFLWYLSSAVTSTPPNTTASA